MSEISCLIFDNEEDEIARISYSLAENWRTIRGEHSHVPDLSVQTVSDERSARKILQTPGNGIQLFLCDVLIPDREGVQQMHGLQLIQLAKSSPKIPVVVALSKGPDKTHAGDFFGRIIGSGADLFFEKGPFESKEGLSKTKEIVQLLEAQGLLRYLGVLNKEVGHEQSVALESAFEKIGPPNLSAIASYFCLNKTVDNVYISALKPGLSGADVFVARYSSTQTDLSKKGVLLKISRNPESLKHEYDTYQREVVAEQAFSSTLIVDFLPIRQPCVVNGWSAIGSRFEHNATTLLTWLSQANRTQSVVEGLLNDLFLGDGLVATYSSTKTSVEGDPITTIRKALLTSHRSVRVLSALNELEPLVNRHCPSISLTLVRKLITDGELGCVVRSQISKRTSASIQHGDLHGSNVLVVATGLKNRPKIIDYANIASLPWATDLVRLFVDIVVSNIDRGIDSYEWESLGHWVAVGDILALGPIKSDLPDSMQDQESIWAAIIWLRTHLFSIVSLPDTSLHRAEYLIAVGLELLRASYRKEELPAPKRAFGLVAAEIALKRAEQELLQNN